MAKTSAASVAVNVLTSPGEAFRSIKDRPRFGLPMILVVLFAVAASGIATTQIDLGWVTEQQLRSQTFIDLTEEQIQQRVEAAAEAGPMLTIVIQTIAISIVLPALLLLCALYLRVVTIFTKDSVRFVQWLGVACWATLPYIFDSIATTVFVLTNDVSFVPSTELNPLTFGNLLQFDRADAPASVRLLMFMSPVQAWCTVLAIIGHKIVSGKNILLSIAVILAPLALLAAVITAAF